MYRVLVYDILYTMNDKLPKVDILGVKIDDISEDVAVDRVKSWLDERSTMNDKRYIVTPNPEFVMLAQKDNQFKKILNQADLAIPDGVGLRLTGKIHHTVTGVDLMERLCRQSVDWAVTVGLLGGRDKVAEDAARVLRIRYPGIKISFATDGGRWKIEDGLLKMEDRKWKDRNPPSIIYPQNTTSHSLPPTVQPCDILFVAFGMGKQERWIAQNLDQLPVKVAMGVGGAFDYISGKVPRAPVWMRSLCLEWLFRLIIQPWRLKRQLSLIKFRLLILIHS